ncbi:reverse transcriptase, putative [Pediculus humanus corporis]|uniref:Reverse transcriptase, putative n=1 Tax=Pediculus humanus subsp. corporis TaxID=121224 RepID=E0W0H3_PEDHC|nr:reverse transcriptase, putative [Pediculus humanus corporis]EEB19129.1 reverse transcriptase, putative [Pediculus humanus corporis]
MRTRQSKNQNKSCSTVDLRQLDENVNFTASDPGHSNDVSHRSPVQETTRSHRIRWTQEDLQELMWCYFYSQKFGSGSESDTFKIWRGRNPNSRKDMTSKKLAAQRRYIIKTQKIENDKLEEIKKNVDSSCSNVIRDNAQIITELNESNHKSKTDTDEQLLTDAEMKSIEERLIEEIKKVKMCPLINREPLRKIYKNKKATEVLHLIDNTLINVLEKVVDINLTTINEIIYAAGVVATDIILGPRKEARHKGMETKKSTSPIWIQRIEGKIERIRLHISLVSEMKKNNNLKKRTIKKLDHLKRIYKLKTMEDIELTMETLKQKVLLYSQRIRRYKKREQFWRQNKLFESDPKKFYRTIREQNIQNGFSTLNVEKMADFWSNIWEKSHPLNKNSTWMNKEKEAHAWIASSTMSDVRMADLETCLKNTANWKSPGLDRVQNFWIKNFTSTHKYLMVSINKLIMGRQEMPEWITTGKTYLLPKKSGATEPKDFRPITCLPTMYKIITAIIAEKIYGHLRKNNIFPPEQYGCRKGSYGCKEVLLINKLIMASAKQKRKNLSMAWIDYQKAFDSVPHEWIIEALKIYKVDPNITAFCEKSMKNWCTQLEVQKYSSRKIFIKRGIFQGDSLSPLLFCMSLIPLSRQLNIKDQGYELVPGGRKITHMLYMDDLKIYAKNEEELNKMLRTVQTFSSDINMKFGLEKCARINIVRGKLKQKQNIEDSEEELIKELDPGSSYKYLGIEENFGIANKEIKPRLKKEYFKRLRLILQSELNGRNKITAVGTLAVPVIEYSFGLVDWTKEEITHLDRRTRKILTMNGALHPKADVDRLYVSRKDGGRGLRQIEAAYQNAIIGMGKYIESHREDPILAQVIHAEEKTTKKGVLKRAKQIVQENKENEIMEEGQLATYNSKAQSQKKLIGKWEQKKLHGQYLKRINAEDINKKSTHNWLRRGKLKIETEAFITAAQDQALRTHNYEKVILKVRQDDKCRICQSQSETIDHLISGCPILAKHEYLERHNKICQYLHWSICREYGMDGLPKEWYNHIPSPVTTVGPCTVLYDQQIHTDRTVPANKPDIILRHNAEKWCKLIEVSVPAEKNTTAKEADKRLKYRNLEIEITRMWGTKTETIPVIVGALGAMPNSIKGNLKKIMKNLKEETIQDIALCGTAHILRKIL